MTTHIFIIMTTHRKTIFGKYFFFLIFSLFFYPFSIAAQENSMKDALELIKKAKTLYKTDQYVKSLVLYDTLESIATKLKNDTLATLAYTMKGHIYCTNGKNKNALDNYYKALEIIDKLGDLEREIIVNSGLMIVLSRMNRKKRAQEVALRSLNAIPNTTYHNKENHVRILTTLSDVYLDAEKYDSVLYYARQGMEMSKSLKLDNIYVDFLIKKGMIFFYKEEYDQSLQYLFEAKEILNQTKIENESFPTIRTDYFIANCYYKKELYDKAIDVLQHSIENFKESDRLKPPAIRSHLLLANSYKQINDYEKASHWHSEFIALNESYQKDKDQTVDTIHEKEIATLTAKQEANKNRIFWILLISLILLICIAIMFFNKQRSNKALFHKLMKEINDLETTKTPLAIVKEEARKEIIIDDQKIEDISKGLKKLEDQEYFLKSDCNLRSMAKKLKTNATYLSQIINIHKEKNFTEYINDLRIEYVLKRLKKDKVFRSYAIQSIASEIGYKSSYSLVKHFKAKTGINPSYYIKNLDKQYADTETIV